MNKRRRTYKSIKQHTLLELGQDSDSIKTGMMFRLERKFRCSIQELLQSNGDTLKTVGNRLGINYSTASKWRKRFSIASPPAGRRRPKK